MHVQFHMQLQIIRNCPGGFIFLRIKQSCHYPLLAEDNQHQVEPTDVFCLSALPFSSKLFYLRQEECFKFVSYSQSMTKTWATDGGATGHMYVG